MEIGKRFEGSWNVFLHRGPPAKRSVFLLSIFPRSVCYKQGLRFRRSWCLVYLQAAISVQLSVRKPKYNFDITFPCFYFLTVYGYLIFLNPPCHLTDLDADKRFFVKVIKHMKCKHKKAHRAHELYPFIIYLYSRYRHRMIRISIIGTLYVREKSLHAVVTKTWQNKHHRFVSKCQQLLSCLLINCVLV